MVIPWIGEKGLAGFTSQNSIMMKKGIFGSCLVKGRPMNVADWIRKWSLLLPGRAAHC